MSDDLKYTAFFGDRERDFALTTQVILELERATGVGIGGLARRVFASDFKHADMIEVIRLGLIGAGENPQRAGAPGLPRKCAVRGAELLREGQGACGRP